MIAKSRLPGGSDREIEPKIRRTSFPPRWRGRAQSTQCASPCMQGIIGEDAGILGACSPFEPGANISRNEAVHSRRGQLFRIDKSSLFAILPESPNPLEINHNGS